MIKIHRKSPDRLGEDALISHNPPEGTMGSALLFCLFLAIALAKSLNDWRLTSVNI